MSAFVLQHDQWRYTVDKTLLLQKEDISSFLQWPRALALVLTYLLTSETDI